MSKNKKKRSLEDVKTLEAKDGDFEFEQEETIFASEELAAVDNQEDEPLFTIPCEVELQEPIEIGSRTIDALVFRNKLKVSYMEHMPLSGGKFGVQKVGHYIPIIAKMTGELMTTVKQISFVDFQKCAEIVGFFISAGPTTGDTGSE